MHFIFKFCILLIATNIEPKFSTKFAADGPTHGHLHCLDVYNTANASDKAYF
jgi:hypothetical protein